MYLDIEATGKQIRKRRQAHGWSQEKLAELSNYSTQHISNIERGQVRASIEALVHIADALNATPNELLCYSNTKSRDFIYNDIAEILDKASNDQLKVIADTLSALIESWNRLGQESRF